MQIEETGTMELDKKRYQQCNWLHRQWRKRWYLLVPFTFLNSYLIYLFGQDITKWPLEESIEKFWWTIAISEAEMRMNYYYTLDEVEQNVLLKLTEIKNAKKENNI